MNKILATWILFVFLAMIVFPLGCVSGLCQQRDIVEQSYSASEYPYIIDTYSGYVYCKSYEILESGNVVAIDYYELDGRDFSLCTGEATVIESKNLVFIDKRKVELK
ncbi:MAG: hypothetical protein WC491_08400 [Candidatus Omnitrophota bacterium]|jgi:hypothetical protein